MGLDYPIGFVRWTEQRNFEAVLGLMAEGKLIVDPLITHRFGFDDALAGYEAVGEKGAMGIVLEYAEDDSADVDKQQRVLKIGNTSIAEKTDEPAVAFIGAGGFTTRMLLPLLPAEAIRKTIVSSTGVSAAHAGEKFGFESISSDSSAAMSDPDIDAVFITTPHNSHASMVCEALDAGKHVFVEKPLAMNHAELEQVAEAMQRHPDQILMVGFNRRFSPHTVQLKKWLSSNAGPKTIVLTINAGAIPSDHWTQDLKVGGGRIIGEGCHFIDLARFLAGSPIVSHQAMTMCGGDGRLGDCVSIQLGFADGSMATIHYLANGSKDFPKERIEVFSGGKVLACDNFRKSVEIGGKGKLKTSSQDKGHAAELTAFISSIRFGGKWPIPADELLEVSRVTIDVAQGVYESLASHS